VLIAVVVGAVVGILTLRLRAWIGDSAASTAIGFTVPFLVPARRAPERLGPRRGGDRGHRHRPGRAALVPPTERRLSDEVNWRTVELVLEGGIFLIMGHRARPDRLRRARARGSCSRRSSRSAALAILLAVQAAYVALILWAGRRRAGRFDRSRLENLDARLDAMSAQGGSATLPASNTDPGTGPGKGKGKGRR
jgi:CPA1 family monovalent cation:H+ antiporter